MIEEDKAVFECLKRHIERLETAQDLLFKFYCEQDPYDFPKSKAWKNIKNFFGFDDSE